jgi:hypothetical protein
MSRNRFALSSKVWAFLAAATFCAPAANAADTIETFEPGASDFELYVGYDGIGLDKKQRTVYGDAMLGYGLRDGLSAYAGVVLEGNDGFSTGATTNYIGVFGTPVDTDHVDLDLIFGVSSGGPDQMFEVRPALELNLDSDADMAGAGAYVRAPFPIYGRQVSAPIHPTDDETELTFQVETTAGVYAMLAPGHQLLVEYNMGFHPDPNEDERTTEIGGITLGYNVELADGFELINQVFGDIPQDDEGASFGVMTGFLATVPTAGE